MTESFKIGFIGYGNMASAIVEGILAKKILSAAYISLYDINIKADLPDGVRICDSVAQLCEKSDILFLCVKPNIIPEVLPQITTIGKALVSIAAGVTTERIEQLLHVPQRIARVMPNMPLTVGAGMSCIQIPNTLAKEEAVFVEQVFLALGKVAYVPEDLMDTVTGISGSGPAYVYYFIQGLASAGVKNGLEADISMQLALQTFIGACAMLSETKNTPEELIRNVCSPGGTTLEAMKVFKQRRTDHIILEAVDACIEKSRKLSE